MSEIILLISQTFVLLVICFKLLCLFFQCKSFDFEDCYHFFICHFLLQVLATGLSGLYSALPRKLEIESPDWHRLTTDDINDIPELSQFINSLEFCNAVAKIAHPAVQKVLHEYLYHGFLVPVMGPALLLQVPTKTFVKLYQFISLYLIFIENPFFRLQKMNWSRQLLISICFFDQSKNRDFCIHF